jgi:hypothetical protein
VSWEWDRLQYCLVSVLNRPIAIVEDALFLFFSFFVLFDSLVWYPIVFVKLI